MNIEATKLELIEWLTKLDNEQMLGALLFYKRNDEAASKSEDFTPAQKAKVYKGSDDVKAGRVMESSEVWKKYGRCVPYHLVGASGQRSSGDFMISYFLGGLSKRLKDCWIWSRNSRRLFVFILKGSSCQILLTVFVSGISIRTRLQFIAFKGNSYPI